MGKLTPEHHAVLFALIVKRLEENWTETYRGVVKAGVRRYGFERGRRMAARALEHGDDCRAENYLCYGEWRSSDYPEQQSIVEASVPYTLKVKSCCWCEAWKRHGLMEWGKLYCEDVDTALTIGFNPEYPLELRGILSHGADGCRFVYPAIVMDERTKSYVSEKKKSLGDTALRDFSYHTAHLFWTMLDETERRLGKRGREAVEQALNDWGGIFGAAAVDTVLSYETEKF